MNAILGMISETAEERLGRKLTDDEKNGLQSAINEHGGMPIWQAIRQSSDVNTYLQGIVSNV